MQNSTAAMENSLVVPQKVKHGIIMQPRNHTPQYTSKRNENISPPKQVHKCLQQIIPNSKKVETTQMSINE